MEAVVQKERGQSLVEMLVAIAITGVVLTSVVTLTYLGLLTGRTSRENSFAQTLIQDMSSAVRGMAAIEWRALWGSEGLVGYWGMNEGTDTRLYDPAGGNNATAVGTPAWQSAANCKVGACLSFNGSTQYADVGSHPSFDSGRITVSAWVYSNVTTSALAAVSRYAAANGNWLLDHGSSASTYRFLVRIGGADYTAQSGTGFSTGQWNHIAGTYDGSYARLYVNGVQTATSTLISGFLAANATAVRIGNRAGGTNYWNGRIDEVKVFNRALSSSEIAAMYARPGGLYPQNLGGFWAVKEGSETVSSSIFGTFTRWFDIGAVRRDSSGDIVTAGGTPDPSTIKVNYFVLTPRGKTISAGEYVTRSESRVTVQEDWSGGPNASGTYTSATNVFATSTQIDATSTPGQIRIQPN